ncbi:hypothetical protein Lal_00024385 [Lupinus albus]|nr:hypothetical protein Lal_00024385 [Lupinus albus]
MVESHQIYDCAQVRKLDLIRLGFCGKTDSFSELCLQVQNLELTHLIRLFIRQILQFPHKFDQTC